MKVSVIIPTYKPQSYIWDCLNSIVNQTLDKSEYEIVLVLNGCKEPFYTPIKEYIEKHPDNNWKFIQTDIGGVSNARNRALSCADGDFITFIDDDDYVSIEYLSDLLTHADTDTISICNPWMFNDGYENIRLPHKLTSIFNQYTCKGKLNYHRVLAYFSGPCMKLFPSHYLEGRYFDTRFKNGEDSIYMYLISNHFNRVRFTSSKAIYYRRYREGSALKTRRTFKQNCYNNYREALMYIQYYLTNPFKYSFMFMLVRTLGCFYCIIFNKQ